MPPPRALLEAALGRRRVLSVAGVVLAVFVAAFATDSSVTFRLGYVFLFGILAAALWSRLNRRGLDVQIQRSAERLSVSQTLVERLQIANRSRTQKLWLEVEEHSDLPEHRAKYILTLGGQTRRSWRFETVCARRGLYTLGPVHVRSGDPFGLFRTDQEFAQPHKLLVYPQTLALPYFSVPPANLPGDGRFRRRTHYVTPNAAGIRDYEPGDSVNRIHWPSTLRTGRMMVKTFELDPASDLWILLDLSQSAQAGSGDESTVEYSVTAAASVARHFIPQNRAVGLMMFGGGMQSVEPDRGGQQLTRILSALAVAQPVGNVPLATLLYQQSRRWGRHTTLVVISAASDRRWADALRILTQRGVRAAVILLDIESFGGRGDAEAIELALRAAEIQVNRVRQGDYLPEVLATPGAGRGAAR